MKNLTLTGSYISDLIFWLIIMLIVWFVGDASIFRLLFCGIGFISLLMIFAIQTISSFGRDTQALMDQLVSLNKRINAVNKHLKRIGKVEKK